MEQNIYAGLMNRAELSPDKKKNILTNCLKKAEMKKQSKAGMGIRWAGLAAGLAVLTVVAILGIYSPSTQPQGMPLVIVVKAEGTSGEKIYTSLELNQKVKLYPEVSSLDGKFAGFAFDMTLLPGMHIAVQVVDKDGKVLRNDQSCGIHYDECRWAWTGGDDISSIIPDIDGSAWSYKKGLDEPKKHGKSIIWQPNEEGNNYVRLLCYDKNFNRVMTFYLEMSEEDGNYFAEIIRIE